MWGPNSGGKALHLAHEDGGHHQHGSQIHTKGCPEEERLEENGSKGDWFQKICGEICCHKLCIFLFKTMVLMFLSRCYVFHIFKPPLFYFEKRHFQF